MHDEVHEGDIIGHCCFESRNANKQRPRTRFIREGFRKGVMSADRFKEVNMIILVDIHDGEGSKRQPIRAFYGWYIFKAKIIIDNKGRIKIEKTDTNPWHVDVYCPEGMFGLKEAMDQFCEEIAANSEWLNRDAAYPNHLGFTSNDEDFLNNISKSL